MLPSRVRRMILLGSVIDIVSSQDAKDNHHQFIIDVNSRLRLAREQNSIDFAIELGKILWRDIKARYEELNCAYAELADIILEQCPESLKYTSDSKMRVDLINAIKFAHQYVH